MRSPGNCSGISPASSTRWLPAYESSSRSYLTVALGCTGGRHRSVYMAERLHGHLEAAGLQVQLRHRELQ
jgi:UPF0042 nucleotide-binding protein